MAGRAPSLEIEVWDSLADRWYLRPWQIRAARKCVGVDEEEKESKDEPWGPWL